jgi:hypothetical protein
MLFPQTTREFITTCDIFKPIQACPAYDIVLKKKKMGAHSIYIFYLDFANRNDKVLILDSGKNRRPEESNVIHQS